MASNTNLKAGAMLLVIAVTAALVLNKFDPIYKLGFAVILAPVVITLIINTPVVPVAGDSTATAGPSGVRSIPWAYIGKALQYLSVAIFGYILFTGN
jgi:hypothetical protein